MGVEQTYGDQVTFVGVPSLADIEDIEQFVDERGVSTFDQIPDVDGELWDRFGVARHRTYVLIDDDGSFDLVPYGTIEQDVQDLIAR